MLHTKAFSISSLKKLKEMKIKGDADLDLLSFLIQRLLQEEPETNSKLRTELQHVIKASSIELSDIQGKVRDFSQLYEFTQKKAGVIFEKVVTDSEAHGYDPDMHMQKQLLDEKVLEGAKRIKLLNNLSDHIKSIGGFMTSYFAEDDSPESFIKNLASFLQDFDKACKITQQKTRRATRTANPTITRRRATVHPAASSGLAAGSGPASSK